MTLAQARRRFLGLTFARWLGTGFLIPVLVLVLTDAGLGLGQVGLVFAVYGGTTAALELPTGGLADGLGRRPVLAGGAVLLAALDAVLLLGGSLPVFLVGAAVGGTGRALASGPLEAWFVDTARAADPSVPLRPDLGRAGALEGAALAVGALASLAAANLPLDAVGISPVTAPVAAALVVDVVFVGAVVKLVDERGRPRVRASAAARDLPSAVVEGVRLARRSPTVGRLLGATLLIAVAFVSVELLWQPRFAELLGGPDAAARIAGLLVAALALAATVGAAAAGALPISWTRRPARAAGLASVVVGAALVGMAATSSPWLLALGIVAAYAASGGQDVLVQEQLHEAVPNARRATMVSVQSLVGQSGNLVTSLLIAPLAAATSIGVGWLVAAAAVMLSAPVLASVPSRSRVLDDPVEPPSAASHVGHLG